MIKKIILILVLFSAISACGKKGDPFYQDSDKKSEINFTLKNKA